MPPKARGHNVMGRDKLFHTAVEHVHVGIGHTVLGNFSLNLSQPFVAAAADGAQDDFKSSAMFRELHELALSHTSHDFKKLRYEIQDMCENMKLFRHFQRTIAQKLLTLLCNRETEAFAAFLKLAVAFARDSGRSFLPYLESFVSVVHRSLYDERGFFVPDAQRLQLVFLTQVMWLRELCQCDAIAGCLEPESPSMPLLQRVLKHYATLLGDSKPYVQRLAAETLASVCRRHKNLIRFVRDAAFDEISAASSDEKADGPEADDEETRLVDDSHSDDGAAEQDETLTRQADLHSISNGLTYFVAELLRGLKGSLGSVFSETLVYLVAEVFDMAPWRHERKTSTQLLRSVGVVAVKNGLATLIAETQRSQLGTEEATVNGRLTALQRITEILLSLLPTAEQAERNHAAVHYLLEMIVDAVHADEYAMLRSLLMRGAASDDDDTSKELCRNVLGIVSRMNAIVSRLLRGATANSSCIDAVALRAIRLVFPVSLVPALVLYREARNAGSHSSSLSSARLSRAAHSRSTFWNGALTEACDKLASCAVDAMLLRSGGSGGERSLAAVVALLQDVLLKTQTLKSLYPGSTGAFHTTLVETIAGKALSQSLKAAAHKTQTWLLFARLLCDTDAEATSIGFAAISKTDGLALQLSQQLASSLQSVLQHEGTEAGCDATDETTAALVVDIIQSHGCLLDSSTLLGVIDAAPASEMLAGRRERSFQRSFRVQLMCLSATLKNQALGATPLQLACTILRGALAENAANIFNSHLLRAALALMRHLTIHSFAVSATQDLLSLMLMCLAAPVQQLRVASLEALQRLCSSTDVDPGTLPALITAEKADPLSTANTVDVKQAALTQLSFRANAGAITSLLEKRIVAMAMIGLWHVKFAGIWPVATRILSNLIRHEKGTSSSTVWEDVIVRYARTFALGELLSQETNELLISDRHVGAEESEDAPTYVVALNDMQLHDAGELVSKSFAYRSSSSGAMLELLRQARCSRSPVLRSSASVAEDAFFAASRVGVIEAVSWRTATQLVHTTAKVFNTDAVTVSKTFLGLLKEVAAHISGGRTMTEEDRQRTLLVESVVRDITNVDRGEPLDAADSSAQIAPVPSHILRRGVDDRLVLAFETFSGCASLTTASAAQGDGSPWPGIFWIYVYHANSKIQLAALECLKKLKAYPVSAYFDKLSPFCSSSTKSIFSFLSTFHIEDDVEANDRAGFLSVVLALTLPHLSKSVAKEKLKDQAVLGRRLLAMLQHVASDEGFRDVMSSVLCRVFGLQPTSAVKGGHGTASKKASSFDQSRVLQLLSASSEKVKTLPARKIEAILKQLQSSLRLLAVINDSAGPRFTSYVPETFNLLLHAYSFTAKASSESPAAGLGVMCTQIRKQSAQLAIALLDGYPDAISNLWLLDDEHSSENRKMLSHFADELHKNTKTTLLQKQNEASRGNGAHLSAATSIVLSIRLAAVFLSHQEYASIPEIYAQFATTVVCDVLSLRHVSTSELIEALRCVKLVIHGAETEPADGEDDEPQAAKGSADRQLQKHRTKPKKGSVLAVEKSSLSSQTLSYFSDRGLLAQIFQCLYKKIAFEDEQQLPQNPTGDGEHKENTRPAARPSGGVAYWKALIDTVQSITAHVPCSATTRVTHLQLLELMVRLTGKTSAMADLMLPNMCAATISALAAQVDRVPLQLISRMGGLLNSVSKPGARLSLCAALTIALPKVEFDAEDPFVEESTQQQLVAAGHVVQGLNSFLHADSSERGRADAGEYISSRLESSLSYDFERRYHCFHSVMRSVGTIKGTDSQAQHHTPASGSTDVSRPAKKSRSESAVEKSGSGAPVLAQGVTVKRHADDDVALPRSALHIHPVVMQLFCLNAMFFLRDHERTIRALSSQFLSALLSYAGRLTSNYADAILDRCVRPIVLPSLRRGIVAKDPSTRNEHLHSFGSLAVAFPQHFPSFKVLASRNSEQNFFTNISHMQHKCRLNALGSLRRHAADVQVRDHLRVFVPYLVCLLKDFGQGKREEGVSEGRAKGFVESVLLTLAAISQHLPWEGYHYVLSVLLSNARGSEDLKPLMLKGVVHMLGAFHFLDTLDAEPVSSAAAADDEDGDQPVEAEELEAAQKRREWRNTKIIQVLEKDVLPQLYATFTTKGAGDDHAPRKGELALGQNTVEAVHSGGKVAAKTNRAIVQLPVAVAITKIVRLFPNDRYEQHIELILAEIVTKLRTKVDKHRESARKMLCAVMCEVGPSKLHFVLKALRDQLVHGYQIHVLGYTVVTLLLQLFDPNTAAKKAKSLKLRHKIKGEKTATDGADANNEPDDDDEDDDELLPVHSAKFDAEENRMYLSECVETLFAIFTDDYLGETSHQKEQIELMSTLVEVKRSRALQGFVFLATHCDADQVIDLFVKKITWVLAPPTESELEKNRSLATGSTVAGNNTKFLLGEKNAAVDLKFVSKVRLLALRVARGVMKNPHLDLPKALTRVQGILADHHALRERKAAEFEAKDGTRRVRGNIEKHTTAAALSLKQQYEQNFAVAQRPERIDVDFNANAVLATQSQAAQKLKVYRGRYAKNINQAARNFVREEPVTAVMLDTVDEFCLRLILTIMKHSLGRGRDRKARPAPQGTTQIAQEGTEDEERASLADGETPAAAEQVEEDEIDAEVDVNDDAAVEEALADADADGDDDEEAAEELQEPVTSVPKQRKATFFSEHAALLERLLPVVVNVLEGEGSDAVVAHAMDVLQALLAVRPPLQCVSDSAGKQLFDLIVQFFERGGTIKQKAQKTLAGIIGHANFVLPNEDASQLMRIVRADLIERNAALSSAIALTFAIVAKKAIVEEVYDIIPVVTELMLHLSPSQTIRRRCCLVISKFLMEYKLSEGKLKSHIDLYVRNLLDYPESSGRIALLELLFVIIGRLPVVLLSEEAPVMFVPLVTTVTQAPWRECKERAAQVLNTLIENAGLAPVAPTLQQWIQSTDGAVRVTGLQTWALLLPTVGKLCSGNVEQFVAATQWSFDAIQKCCVEPLLSAKQIKKRLLSDPSFAASSKKKASVADEAWPQVFYALRCIEAVVAVSPIVLFPQLGAGELVPHVTDVLLHHKHPWVRAAAARLLVSYMYDVVHQKSKVLDDAAQLPAVVRALPTASLPSTSASLPYLLDGERVTQQRCEEVLKQLSKASMHILQAVGALDVKMERLNAARAIDDAYRGSLLKAQLFCAKAISRIAIGVLSCASTSFDPSSICSHYSSIWSTTGALVSDVIKNRTVAGFVVRCATVAQIFGGLFATLPVADTQAARVLIRHIDRTILCNAVPEFLGVCVHEGMLSTKLATIATTIVDVVKRELQSRSSIFSNLDTEDKAGGLTQRKRKQSRTERGNPQRESGDIEAEVSAESLMVKLAAIADELRAQRTDATYAKAARKEFKRTRT